MFCRISRVYFITIFAISRRLRAKAFIDHILVTNHRAIFVADVIRVIFFLKGIYEGIAIFIFSSLNIKGFIITISIRSSIRN